MTVNQRIGSRIREVRELRGYTAQELADAMQEHDMVHPVSQNIIYRWEAGKQPVPADSLIAIMTVLQVSPYYLLGSMSPIDPEEQRVHNALHTLPSREQHIIYHLITRWIGCVHCILETGLLYACLPECARKLAVRNILRLSEKYHDQLDPIYTAVDVEKIYSGMRRLDKGTAAVERKNRLNISDENK